MRLLIIPALAASLALGGCQTTDDAIHKHFTAACDLMEIGHQAFLTFTSVLTLPASLLKTEVDAHDEAVDLCASDPATVNTAKVTLAVIKLGAIIANSLIEARKQAAAAGIVE